MAEKKLFESDFTLRGRVAFALINSASDTDLWNVVIYEEVRKVFYEAADAAIAAYAAHWPTPTVTISKDEWIDAQERLLETGVIWRHNYPEARANAMLHAAFPWIKVKKD